MVGWNEFNGQRERGNGILQLPLPAPLNVLALASGHNVNISWTVPNYNATQMTLQGYNINRNGTKINTSLVNGFNYTDQNVLSGHYTYCVSAQYNIGESPDSCSTVDVAVGIAQGDRPELEICPNPAHGRVMIKTSGRPSEISIFNQYGNAIPVAGKNVSSDLSAIDISDLPAGIYLISVSNRQGTARIKLVVY